MAALPLINLITGLVVAALTSVGRRRRGARARRPGRGRGRDHDLARADGPVLEVDPPPDRRPPAGHRGDREGRYDVSGAGDDRRRARRAGRLVQPDGRGPGRARALREAFGTYLDNSVAEYILSEGFAEEGEELEVSVLVCDVRDFTSFAPRASAKEVVSRLNELFEIVVPIVGRHGGHVDKFLGDGLLAVFGAPEPYPDHADRAVLAACEMATKVNSDDGPG